MLNTARKYRFKVLMACNNSSSYIPSDQEFLLNYFDHLPSDDSDSDFDGYVDDSASEDEESPTDQLTSFPDKTSTSFPSTPPISAPPSNSTTHTGMYT